MTLENFLFYGIPFTLFYIIAEIFGRRKHIGFGWTFGLLLSNFIIGGIALILSPSINKKPTKGRKEHKIAGWLSIVLGFINLIYFNLSFIGLLVLGFYLIMLSNGKVINKKPKFYFNKKGVYEPSTIENELSDNNINTKQNEEYLKNIKQIKSLRDSGILTEIEYSEKIKILTNSLNLDIE